LKERFISLLLLKVRCYVHPNPEFELTDPCHLPDNQVYHYLHDLQYISLTQSLPDTSSESFQFCYDYEAEDAATRVMQNYYNVCIKGNDQRSDVDREQEEGHDHVPWNSTVHSSSDVESASGAFVIEVEDSNSDDGKSMDTSDSAAKVFSRELSDLRNSAVQEAHIVEIDEGTHTLEVESRGDISLGGRSTPDLEAGLK
jgi:hypothetical protein